MASRFYDATANDKMVSDGDIAYADDLNKVNTATEAATDLIASEIDSALVVANSNSTLAKEWAVNALGVLPHNAAGQPVNSTEYSSKANAAESRSWASQEEDTDVVGADNITKTGARSAKHWAIKTEDYHTGAVASAAAADASADAAALSAAQAAASAASAVGANTISAGSGITVTPTGAGPYNFAISHTDPSSVAKPTLTGAKVLSALEFDTYGHVLVASTRDLSPANIGAATSGHTHTEYAPWNSGTGKLTAVTGTTSSWSCSSLAVAGGITAGSFCNFNGGLGASGILMSAGNEFSYDGQPVMAFASATLYLGSSGGPGLTSANLAAYEYVAFNTARGGTKQIVLSWGNAFYPNPDNTISLGVGSQRWSAVYAVVGTIQTSDERLKDFSSENMDASWIYDLVPAEYTWKDDEDKKPHFGFSAQKVEAAIGRDNVGPVTAPFEDKDPNTEHPLNNPHYALNYSEFIAPMVKCIQEQKNMIQYLSLKVESLEAKVNGLSRQS